eukprot:Hpha_TRINITY_DN31714_c0_g1::TRINITY_DN31714_c0_g1_i1::g.116437::m.116437/K09584/PDIA6, TXNDC7; protein disulfide-isomerase A6
MGCGGGIWCLVALQLLTVINGHGIAPSSVMRGVAELTPENIARETTTTKEPWLLEFYTDSCGHCANFAVVLRQLGEAAEQSGQLKIGKYEVRQRGSDPINRRYGVRGTPHIVLVDGESLKVYQGTQDLQSVVGWLKDEGGIVLEINKEEATLSLGQRKVQQLAPGVLNGLEGGTARNFGVFVAFGARWCARCVHQQGVWKAAAEAAGEQHAFAMLDADLHGDAAEAAGVLDLPAYKYYPPGSAPAAVFPGGSAGDLTKWVQAQLAAVRASPKDTQAGDEL